MFLETTLLFKTLVILCGQLIIILATCFYFLSKAKRAYENNTTLLGISFKGSVNLKGKLDLIPYLKPEDTFPKEMVLYKDNESALFKEAKDQDEVITLLKEALLPTILIILSEFLKVSFKSVSSALVEINS